MYYTNIIKSISARGLFTLLALIMSISLHAQNATVKGVIVDELFRLREPQREV